MSNRKLSVHKEHELLQKLEDAGMNEELAQAVIESRGNKLAKGMVAFIANGEQIVGAATLDIRSIQLSRLIQLGYAKAAGLSNEAFAKLIPVPENKKNALLVIPANIISIDKQMELVGGSRNYLNLNSLKDTVLTPDRPYWIYGVENGKKMLGQSPDVCVKDFAKQSRRGLTVVEGINLVAQYPDLLKDHYIDLPGSRYGADYVPDLSLDDDEPGLYYSFSGDANSRYGSASCGS
ncbi:MAG: DUF5701 family protein [Patescibacteria group bacterium]